MYQVMVVEDEQWIRGAMVKMVESIVGGYEVVAEAGNGEEALDLIFEVWPTIVITDIKMPKKDGLWLVQEIKERNLPIIPIIVTGYDQFEYAQQAIRYGVSDFLLKPVMESEVLNALKGTIDRLKYHHTMHAFLLEIQEFINQIQDHSGHDFLKELLKLIKSLYDTKTLSVGERHVLLKIFSGQMNDLIVSIFPDFERKILCDMENEGVRSHFQQLLEQWMKCSTDLLKNDSRSVIRNACEFLQQNYYRDLSMMDVTDRFNISVSHFSLLFKKHTGQTFVNYLNAVRINKAKELLTENDLKIYEIAEMVGFISPPHFNRVFKQINGYSPKEYRKIMNL
ncbi:response regulator [Alkalihalobacillus sp. MEB130]|uniref:response regulator n=1 Tax=Alkalihalobacillus sp. MEB130 TaxID=2976704 RepID=UPI0028E044B9|nr:response regulator [Alkalihalobacillus sp. MEB130]MDT8860194.1 response regulator [Alkalihalobacillus sp. MEB130]